MKYCFLLLWFVFSSCLADSIKTIETCELKQGEKIQLIKLNTIDGDTLYLKFRNIITGAFLDNPRDTDYTGSIILSKCINNSLVFALNYGSPYIKGCLVTGWQDGFKGKTDPEGFCFAEKNTPESVWFGDKNILIIIKNRIDIYPLEGKYIIYDNTQPGKRSYVTNELPPKSGYKIFHLKPYKDNYQ